LPAKIFTVDTILAIIGTLAASLSVVINQQWLSETRDAITVLMEEQTESLPPDGQCGGHQA